MALVTVAQPSEGAVILKSFIGANVVYVPIGRLLTTARLHKSLALLNANIVSVSSPTTCLR